jgi:hypothetical protein
VGDVGAVRRTGPTLPRPLVVLPPARGPRRRATSPRRVNPELRDLAVRADAVRVHDEGTPRRTGLPARLRRPRVAPSSPRIPGCAR